MTAPLVEVPRAVMSTSPEMVEATANRLLAGLPLPVLREYVPAMQSVPDCLALAVDNAKGVALVGGQGVGKTLALRVFVRQFEREQRASRVRQGARRRIVIIPKLEAATRRKVFIAVYRAAFDVEPPLRVHGERLDDDKLRNLLVVRLSEESIAALVFEDAQSFSPEVLQAIRDIMAVAQDFATERVKDTPEGEEVQAKGVGILLVGTHDLEINLKQMADRHWLVTVPVGGVAHEHLPTVFGALMPAFAAAAKEMGEVRWSRFLKVKVSGGVPVPISHVEDIVRVYVMRTLAEQPHLTYLRQIPWDQELFEQVVAELQPFMVRLKAA